MNLKEAVLGLLYPPKCPFCGCILDRDSDGLCDRCQRELPWTGEGEVRENIEFCDLCLSPLWYRGRAVEGVHRYKFRGGQIHAKLFGELMAQCLHDRWEGTADLVTWVPLSKKRLRERGYDQARLLAQRMAERLELPVRPTLEKTRNTTEQSSLTEEAARRANVKGVYRALEGCDVEGKHVLLVDDVTTSGATLSECAACLRMAGAASVTAITLARAGK